MSMIKQLRLMLIRALWSDDLLPPQRNPFDFPEETNWFADFGPKKVIGPCPHKNCDHVEPLKVVAAGPSKTHYALMECYNRCNGQCRGWMELNPEASSPVVIGDWRQVDSYV